MRRAGVAKIRAAACGAVACLIAVLCCVPAAEAEAPEARRIQVFGPDGRPLEGARLLPVAKRREGRAIFDPLFDAITTSDAKGRIADWDPARAGTLGLVVWMPGTAAVLVPARGTGISLRLMPAKPTRGLLRRGPSTPAAGVTLLAIPRTATADLLHRTKTGTAGEYTLPGLHAGSWDVFLEHKGGRLQRIARVDAGARATDAELQSATSVRGRLLDVDGGRRSAVVGVRLRFRRADRTAPGFDALQRAEMLQAVETDEDGVFVAAGLAAGVYDVELLDPAWAFEGRAPRVQVEFRRARQIETWFARKRQLVSGSVVDIDDRPLSGMDVRLLVDPTEPWPDGATAAVTVSVRTDASGRFRIPQVAPGSGYRLIVTGSGYSPWVSNPFDVDRGRETKLDPVVLKQGWRVLLRVRDVDGDPVAGARVTAVSARRPTTAKDKVWAHLGRSGSTDATGRLELIDLPGDDVLVEVVAAGFEGGHTIVDYPRVSDMRKADVTLHPAARLEGKVVPADGGPKGPFVVRARRRDGEAVVETSTNERGAFVFTHLADTATDITVRLASDPKGHPLTTVENVVPGVEEHLEILLPVLRAVRGTVDAMDVDGTPGEVVVETKLYDPATERYVWRAAARAAIEQEGTQGRFSITGLPPGLYVVRAVQGALDSGTTSVLLDEQDVGGVTLRIPSGARIVGTVLDAESKPVLGARITLTRWHGDDPSEVRARDALRFVSDERGDFLFDDIAPGVWRVEAHDEDRAPAVEFVRVRDGEVRVTRDLQLTAGGVLSGTVEDADGRPLDAVTVRVRRFDGDEAERTVRTDAKGIFRARNLRPGTYHLRVVAATVSGGPWIEAVAEVEAGSTTTVRFTASEDGAIEGTLRRRGRGVAGAVVDLVHVPEGGGAVRRYRTSTGADGSFLVEQLEAGPYTIQIQSGAWRSAQEVILEAGDHIVLDLEAYEARLRGTVVTRAGDPVPGAFVRARPITEGDVEDAGFFAEGRTDPRGAFVLRGLPVGVYTLTVSAPGHPPGLLARAEADLPGADFDVAVVLGRGGDINLRVVDENDRGVTGALVWLEDAQGAALNREAYVTGAAGRLRIEGVPPGDIRVRVRARGLGRPALTKVRVHEGRPVDVRVEVEPAGAIQLIVTGEGSDPLARTRIDIVRESSGDVIASRRPLSPIRLPAPWGYVPRTGVVTIPELSTGDYTAVISAGRSYAVAKIPIRVEKGETTIVRVTLAPAGR